MLQGSQKWKMGITEDICRPKAITHITLLPESGRYIIEIPVGYSQESQNEALLTANLILASPEGYEAIKEAMGCYRIDGDHMIISRECLYMFEKYLKKQMANNMPIKNNPILIDDELQAAKQREIVKQGISKRGYDHATHVVNEKKRWRLL
jgi:hypothetical protein